MLAVHKDLSSNPRDVKKPGAPVGRQKASWGLLASQSSQISELQARLWHTHTHTLSQTFLGRMSKLKVPNNQYYRQFLLSMCYIL